MRLAIHSLIAAIMLVTLAAASRSSSHKEGKHRHHSVDLLKQQERSIFPYGTWDNISSFPFTQAAAVHRPKALSKRRKTKKTFRSKWAKKHKRKHAELVSLAEKDRRLTVQHLKPLRPQEPQESHSGLECCPTVIEMVQPSGGVNMEGHIVELFRHGDIDQRIYEHSCRPDVLEKPCRFVEKVLRPISRCVQQFSYTYAVVGDHPGGLNDWRLDYIRIRSGCSCEILP